MKRWRCQPQDLWLIFTRRGIDIDAYPAVRAHLQRFKQRLTPGIPGGRKPGSYKWFEIQDNVAYWSEFEQPKIIYPDIYEHQSFAWDTEGFYSVNTTYFIPTGEKWLAALLNSQAVEWFYSQTANRILAAQVGQAFLPAGRPSSEAFSSSDPAQSGMSAPPSIAALEAEIDRLVYGLYGLTAPEIAIVEKRKQP